jgi:hypothetical protein
VLVAVKFVAAVALTVGVGVMFESGAIIRATQPAQ